MPRTQTERDKLLSSFRAKQTHARDELRMVLTGMHYGMLLWGGGGGGKTVICESEAAKQRVTLRQLGEVSPRALFDHLRRYSQDVTLIEDSEHIFRKPEIITILREALDTTERAKRTREVHWHRAGQTDADSRFTFAGGIFIAQNSPLPTTPACRALATRLLVHHYDVTPAELIAHAYHVADKSPPVIYGHKMTTAECVEVLDAIVERSESFASDFRAIEKVYKHYVADEIQHTSHATWLSHLDRLVGDAARAAEDDTADARKARREELVRRIYAETSDAEERKKRFAADPDGGSESTLFRVARQLGLSVGRWGE